MTIAEAIHRRAPSAQDNFSEIALSGSVGGLVHPDYPNISVTWERITPKLAHEYLARNDNNRNIDSGNLSTIAGDMAADVYDDQNPAPLVFDLDGNLTNGQHRLTGIVQTGRTVTMLVVRGVHPDVYLTMDSGKSRTLGNALHRAGYKNYSHLATLLKGCVVFERSGSLQRIDRPASNSACIAFLKKDEARLVSLATWSRTVTKAEKLYRVEMSPKRVGLFRYALEEAGAAQEDIDTFFEALSGKKTSVQPANALRKKLSQLKKGSPTNKAKVSAEYVFAISIKSWNAFIRGEEIGRLSWRAGGAKPEPYPSIVAFVD